MKRPRSGTRRLDGLRIFDGGSHPELVAAVCKSLATRPGKIRHVRFANGEFCPIIEESVRGEDVFLLQTSCAPIDANLVSMLITIDALKRASAGRITAVMPCFFYSRQDKKTRGREPITAKLVANLIQTAGTDRIVVVDLHSPTLQGFFDIPSDHLAALPILAEHFRRRGPKNPVIVSPDAGGIHRARALAEMLGAPMAVLEKERVGVNEVKTFQVIGHVAGRTAIIVDDMIDTAATLVEGIRFLEREGVREFYATCTHAILSGPARERLDAAPLREIVVTDSIPIAPERMPRRLEVLPLAPLLADTIARIHTNRSISELFT